MRAAGVRGGDWHRASGGRADRGFGSVRQKGGKVVSAWAAHGEIDAAAVRSNTFTMEWPPRSGRTAEFPEIDRADWFDVENARAKLVAAQAAFLDRLVVLLR